MGIPLIALQFDVARAAPVLWKKAQDRRLTAREQHSKFLDLLGWVVSKQGFSARQRYPIQYWHDAVKKDGRIDLMFSDAQGKPVLALEVDWRVNSGSFRKLHAVSLSDVAVLGISGCICDSKESAKELRAHANSVIGKPTGGWLPLFHLERGWV